MRGYRDGGGRRGRFLVQIGVNVSRYGCRQNDVILIVVVNGLVGGLKVRSHEKI